MSKENNNPSRTSDKYILRFPDGMRDAIKARAVNNRRSMNSEIILMIEASLAKGNGPVVRATEP